MKSNMEYWKIVVIVFCVLFVISSVILTTVLLTEEATDSNISTTTTNVAAKTFGVQLTGPFERGKSRGFRLESYGLRWDAEGEHVDLSKNELVDLKRDEVYVISPHGSQFVQNSNVIYMRVGDTMQLYRPANSTYKTYIRTAVSTNILYNVEGSLVKNQGGNGVHPVEFTPTQPGDFYFCDNDIVDLCGKISVV